MAVLAASGIPGGPARGDASLASRVSGPPQWDAAFGIPPILGPADTGRYREIFALQKDGRWTEADRLIARLEDRILMGHVLAQRYLHPTEYRSRFHELRDWMARYADHPDARRIYRLALRRKPRGAEAPKSPRPFYGAAVFASLPGGPKTRRRAAPRAWPGRAELSVRHRVGRLVRRERMSVAEKLLESPKMRRKLDVAGIDRARAIIAAGWFRWGNFERALALAGAAAERSGLEAPGAHWWAGLAAYKLRRYAEAARYFQAAARAPSAEPEEVSRAAFWAARAHLLGRAPSEVNRWLLRAAANPRTFYGLIAGRILGQPPAFNWNQPVIGPAAIAALTASPPGKRALALVQVGQGVRARRELRPLVLSTEPQNLRTMAALAVAAGMPNAAFRAAKLLRALTGERVDAALYPLPPWSPDEGYSMDRALVFALARQESGFNARAKSRSGARGLLQLMPATARYMSPNGTTFRGRGRTRLFDPDLNLALGQKYMDYLLAGDTVAGNMIMMFAAYNGGPGNARRWQHQVRHGADPLIFIEILPVRETRHFIKRSLENLWIYRMRLGQQAPTLADLAGGRWPHYLALDGAGPAAGESRR